MDKRYETIILAGGCFWCTEAYFQEEEGIIDAVSGYAGGDRESAFYVLVANGTTRHREAVRVTYDPSIISTEKILDIYCLILIPQTPKVSLLIKGFSIRQRFFIITKNKRR